MFAEKARGEQRKIKEKKGTSAEYAFHSPFRSPPMIQRSPGCACGGSCPTCKDEEEDIQIQTKLKIGAPNDKYEQEAERVADRVMLMPEPGGEPADHAFPGHRHYSGTLQGKSSDSLKAPRLSPYEAMEISQRIAGLEGGGHALPEAERHFLESRFGYDFAHVRLHDNRHAAELAQSVNARAFTVGHNVVFAAGEYHPRTRQSRRLLAHELSHVVQQNSAKRVSRKPTTREALSSRSTLKADEEFTSPPGAYSLRLQLPDGERFVSSPFLQNAAPQGIPGLEIQNGLDNQEEESEEDLQIQRAAKSSSNELWLQRLATFTNPTPQPRDPLARVLQNQPPGLTTPKINNQVVSNHNQVLAQITPTQVVTVGQTGGRVRCKFDRNFRIDTSADVIVASAPGAGGWIANASPVAFGGAACAGRGAVPITMSAQPTNADFVARVRASEQEHVDELRILHDRHFVPYDRFIQGLTADGLSLNTCAQSLAAQLNNRHIQASVGFALGNQAQVNRLDSPAGTHADNAVVTPGPNCASLAITVSQRTARIPGSQPGNVVPLLPATTAFNRGQLTVVGSDLMHAAAVLKGFTTAANANRGLQVINHYGMDSRNTIGPMEYFLSGGNAPSGPFAGANELAINPENYQVIFGLPGANDWAIADVVGNNVNILINFGANRDQAFSAVAIMRQFGFTHLCWVGGTRQNPEMMYFRTTAQPNVREANFPGGGRVEWVRPGEYLFWNFDVNRDQLKDEHRFEIPNVEQDINAALSQNPNWEVDIVGQASRTGTDAINDPLSERRAEQIRAALVAQGVPANRIRKTSVGSRNSLPGISQENLARSRSVRVVLVPRVAAPVPGQPAPPQPGQPVPALPPAQPPARRGGPAACQIRNQALSLTGGTVTMSRGPRGVSLIAGDGTPNNLGMLFIGLADLNPAGCGTLVYVQNVQPHREIVYKDGTRLRQSDSNWYLDTNDPYPSQPFPSSPGSIIQIANDSPQQSTGRLGSMAFTECLINTFEVRDEFRMFLLFRPANGARRALLAATWAFVAHATNTTTALCDPNTHQGGGTLQLDLNVSRIIPGSGNGVATAQMPLLSPNITSVRFQIDRGGLFGTRTFADLFEPILNR